MQAFNADLHKAGRRFGLRRGRDLHPPSLPAKRPLENAATQRRARWHGRRTLALEGPGSYVGTGSLVPRIDDIDARGRASACHVVKDRGDAVGASARVGDGGAAREGLGGRTLEACAPLRAAPRTRRSRTVLIDPNVGDRTCPVERGHAARCPGAGWDPAEVCHSRRARSSPSLRTTSADRLDGSARGAALMDRRPRGPSEAGRRWPWLRRQAAWPLGVRHLEGRGRSRSTVDEAGLPRARALILAAEGRLADALTIVERRPVAPALPLERARLMLVRGQLERAPIRRSLRVIRSTRRSGSSRSCGRRHGSGTGGESPARPSASGPRRLHRDRTPIAELAATGKTNREVAEAAFVIPKTVERTSRVSTESSGSGRGPAWHRWRRPRRPERNVGNRRMLGHRADRSVERVVASRSLKG